MIIEQGTHNALLDSKGPYYSLVAAQRFNTQPSERGKESDSNSASSDTEIDTLVTKENIEVAKETDVVQECHGEQEQGGINLFRSLSQRSRIAGVADGEKGLPKVTHKGTTDTYSIPTMVKRFWKMNSQDWYMYLFGVLAAMAVGMVSSSCINWQNIIFI